MGGNTGRVVQVIFPFFDIFIATVLRDNARKRRKTSDESRDRELSIKKNKVDSVQ